MNFKTIKRIAEFAGYEITRYTGRGMYGHNCVGMCVDVSIFKAGVNMAASRAKVCELFDDVEYDEFPRACFETLGMGVIVYFPDIAWED
jgi:hypothetical protein